MHPIAALNSFHTSLPQEPSEEEWTRGAEILTKYLAFNLLEITGYNGETIRLSRHHADKKAFEIFQRFVVEAHHQIEPSLFHRTCRKGVSFASDLERHIALDNLSAACRLLANLTSKGYGIQQTTKVLGKLERMKNGETSCLELCAPRGHYGRLESKSMDDESLFNGIDVLQNALQLRYS